MTAKDEGRKLIGDLEYLVRSNNAAAKRRGARSFRHASGPFQAEQEIDVCSDLPLVLAQPSRYKKLLL